jgi:hypothetical protein
LIALLLKLLNRAFIDVLVGYFVGHCKLLL